MLISKTIAIPSMRDQKDAAEVNGALYAVWGVVDVEVSLERSEAKVRYDELAASFHDFEQAVLDSGFAIRQPDGQLISSLHDWHPDDN